MSDKNTINNHNNNGLSGGQIALIIIGGILVIGLVAALIAWLMTDKKKNKSKSKANIVQIGGAVNNEQQPGQTANQTTIQTPITPNNTAETNNQSPTNNDAINQQDKDQLIASVVSEATPQVMAATEQFIEQKASKVQKPETTKEETKQEEKQEEENKNDFVQPLMAKAETKSNVDEDDISNENDQKQDKQKAEQFDEMPDYSGNAPFAGFPLGMMMDGNKGENLQPNMQPIPMIFPAQPNQNVNISAEQPNLMPQENDLTNQQNQQYFNDQKNGQENNKKLEFPVDFTYKRGDFEKLMQAGRLNNPLEQLPLENEMDNIDYLKQLDKQEENERKKQQLSNINLPQNVGNLFETANLNENRFNIEEPKGNAALAELPTPPQNDISNLSAVQQTNQQANENEETMDDGVVMPLNMMSVQDQNTEQKPMNNDLFSIPKFNQIKNQNMESIMEDNARPAMVTGGNGSPVSMFNQNANVENSQIDNGMFNKPNFLQEPMPKNDFSNKPAMPNNSMFNQLQPINENEIKPDAPAFMPPMMKMEDKNENKGAPMMQPMPLTQMFAAPMKTNQEAQIDKNNSNQIGNQSAMPTKNQIFDFLMPKQNNNQNEIPNAFNQTNPNILEEQQIQANNNQSRINLGTQNKCTCSLCSGCGGK